MGVKNKILIVFMGFPVYVNLGNTEYNQNWMLSIHNREWNGYEYTCVWSMYIYCKSWLCYCNMMLVLRQASGQEVISQRCVDASRVKQLLCLFVHQSYGT